jgi:methylthioribose-1-phosphate isomerase
MNVRGAPAIAIAAALALAVEAVSAKVSDFPETFFCELDSDFAALNCAQDKFSQAEEAKEWLVSRLEYLKTSRPTAVNLFNDCDR